MKSILNLNLNLILISLNLLFTLNRCWVQVNYRSRVFAKVLSDERGVRKSVAGNDVFADRKHQQFKKRRYLPLGVETATPWGYLSRPWGRCPASFGSSYPTSHRLLLPYLHHYRYLHYLHHLKQKIKCKFRTQIIYFWEAESFYNLYKLALKINQSSPSETRFHAYKRHQATRNHPLCYSTDENRCVCVCEKIYVRPTKVPGSTHCFPHNLPSN